MFDVGFSELVLLAVVALVVLGPEKLPHAARMAGAWLGRIRRTVTSIQIEIEKEVAASELRDRMNQEIERLKAAANPVEEEFRAVENTIRQNLDHSLPAPVPEAPLISEDTPVSTDLQVAVITEQTAEPEEKAEPITTSTIEPIIPSSAVADSDADSAPVSVNLSKSQPL